DLLKAPGRKTPWRGVRNYPARNYMRDEVRVGDGVLFHHARRPAPGVAGPATVASKPDPGEAQFDRATDYYDPKSSRDAPRWYNVDVKGVKRTRPVPLAELRKHKALADMVLLRPGNRLSITPVTPAQWKYIVDRLL